jgi:hypothetical protein
LKKFERISKNRVSSPRFAGLALQRGALTRRASEKVGSNKTKYWSILSQRKTQKF